MKLKNWDSRSQQHWPVPNHPPPISPRSKGRPCQPWRRITARKMHCDPEHNRLRGQYQQLTQWHHHLWDTEKRPNKWLQKEGYRCLQRLEKDQVIDRLLYHRLYPGNTTPCIYGLPKIHKQAIPLRPIVSSTDSGVWQCSQTPGHHLGSIGRPLTTPSTHRTLQRKLNIS